MSHYGCHACESPYHCRCTAESIEAASRKWSTNEDKVKPFQHCKGSVRRWGGKREDYQAIHDFIDHTKMCMPDLRHRALLHSSWGIFMVERVFGLTIVNSDGREVSTRDIAEAHVIEDMGFIPSVEDWLQDLPQSVWHGGIHRLSKEDRYGIENVLGSKAQVPRGDESGQQDPAGRATGADS